MSQNGRNGTPKWCVPRASRFFGYQISALGGLFDSFFFFFRGTNFTPDWRIQVNEFILPWKLTFLSPENWWLKDDISSWNGPFSDDFRSFLGVWYEYSIAAWHYIQYNRSIKPRCRGFGQMLNPRQSAMIQDAGYQAHSLFFSAIVLMVVFYFYKVFFDLLNSMGGETFNQCHQWIITTTVIIENSAPVDG